MFRKTLLCMLITAALPVTAWAVPVEADATGKDQETALKKAEVNAVRKVMYSLADEEFVKQHTSDIRKHIILQSSQLVSGSEILSSGTDAKGNTSLHTRFEVDQDRIADIIGRIKDGRINDPAAAPSATTTETTAVTAASGTATDSGSGTGSGEPATATATTTAASGTATDSGSGTGSGEPATTTTAASGTPPDSTGTASPDPAGSNAGNSGNGSSETTTAAAGGSAGPVVAPMPADKSDTKAMARWVVTRAARGIQDGYTAVGGEAVLKEKDVRLLDSGEEVTTYEFQDPDAGAEQPDAPAQLAFTTSTAPEGVTTRLSFSDGLYKEAGLSDTQKAVVTDLLNNSKGFYSIKDDSLTVSSSLAPGSWKNSDDETVTWGPMALEIKSYDLSNYQDAVDLNFSLPAWAVRENSDDVKDGGTDDGKGGEGGASDEDLIIQATGLAFKAQSRMDSFQTEFAATEISNSEVAVHNLTTGITSRITSPDKANTFSYGLTLGLGQFLLKSSDGDEDGAGEAAEGTIDVRDVTLSLTLNGLGLDPMAKACGIQGQQMSLLKLVRCHTATDEDARDDAYMKTVSRDTTAELSFSAQLSGSRVTATATAGFKPQAGQENAAFPELMEAAVLDADVGIDASLLNKTQYVPEDFAGMLKKYAADPGAAVYTYHLEYRKGELKINGKGLE